MNPEVKKEWLEALRSGEFHQAKGALKKSEGYCCLGVLCELAVKHEVIDEPERTYDNEFEYEGISSDLPYEVSKWAGVEGSDPRVDGQPLSVWNDDKMLNFNEIADMIEKEL